MGGPVKRKGLRLKTSNVEPKKNTGTGERKGSGNTEQLLIYAVRFTTSLGYPPSWVLNSLVLWAQGVLDPQLKASVHFHRS